jgi:hypothetical protein
MYSRKLQIGQIIFLFLIFCQISFAGQRFKYQFEEGKIYKYSTVIESKTSGQAMGQEFTMTSGLNMDYKLSLIDLKDRIFTLMVTFNKFDIKLNMPMMGFNDSTIVMKDYIGKRIKITMTDRGKTLSVQPIDTIPPSRIQMMASLTPTELFKQLLIEFPEKELDVNSTWKKDMPDTTLRGGMKIVTKQNIEFKVVGSETKNGYDCWKITIGGTNMIEGSGSQRGNDVTIDGTVKINGMAYVSPAKGIFVLSEQSVDNDMTTTVTGAQTGASTMTVSTTVKTALVK